MTGSGIFLLLEGHVTGMMTTSAVDGNVATDEVPCLLSSKLRSFSKQPNLDF
jgi:hypothetical protein